MSDCIIQISRDNSFYGSGLTVGIALDGCDVGTLKNGEELRAVAAPGQHELSFYRYRRLDKTISFTIAEGQQNAFFTIKINASNRVDVVGGKNQKAGETPQRLPDGFNRIPLSFRLYWRGLCFLRIVLQAGKGRNLSFFFAAAAAAIRFRA